MDLDHRQAALSALDDDDLDSAERHLRTLLDDEPDDSAAMALLALVLHDQQRLPEARELAQQAVDGEPTMALAHWALGVVLVAQHRLKEAMRAAERAVALDPELAEHHGLVARIHALEGRWVETLRAAERGLTQDRDNVGCAKLRALALRQLGRTADAELAFEEVAAAAPLDTFATAGHAWGLLRRGQRDDALEQFREAIRLDPTNEWAREGILTSLRARNPIYRLFLRYYLWIGTRSARDRWLFILGGFILARMLRRAGKEFPALEPVVWPLLGLYFLFMLGSWIADPLFDLMLLTDRYARRHLKPVERVTSLLVGVTLVVAIGAGVVAVVTGSNAAGALALCGILLLIPLGATSSCSAGWPRLTMGGITAALAAVAVLATVSSDDLRWPLVVVVVIGCILASWLAQWLQTVVPRS